MHLRTATILAGLAILAGCTYEEGFEYQTTATLAPMNSSGVKGSATMGYGIHTSSTTRLRISASGLRRNVAYEVRLFDTKSCDYFDAADANRIDGKSSDPNRKSQAWDFEGEPILVAESLWGSVEKEFALIPPRAPSPYLAGPEKYPTVVLYALGTGQSVACGAISSRPENKRPHT
jgi:hypothetical protein